MESFKCLDHELDPDEQDALHCINLKPEERALAQLRLLEIKGGQWVREEGGVRTTVCQMCLTEVEELETLCFNCWDIYPAPVRAYDPLLKFSDWIDTSNYQNHSDASRFVVSCEECGELIPRGERVRTACCARILCLQCYCEAIEEDGFCPFAECNKRLLMLIWAMDWFYLFRALKPGFHLCYIECSDLVLTDLVKNDPWYAERSAKFCAEAWLVKKFNEHFKYAIWGTNHYFIRAQDPELIRKIQNIEEKKRKEIEDQNRERRNNFWATPHHNCSFTCVPPPE